MVEASNELEEPREEMSYYIGDKTAAFCSCSGACKTNK